jgi:hypothetical protein
MLPALLVLPQIIVSSILSSSTGRPAIAERRRQPEYSNYKDEA